MVRVKFLIIEELSVVSELKDSLEFVLFTDSLFTNVIAN